MTVVDFNVSDKLLESNGVHARCQFVVNICVQSTQTECSNVDAIWVHKDAWNISVLFIDDRLHKDACFQWFHRIVLKNYD